MIANIQTTRLRLGSLCARCKYYTQWYCWFSLHLFLICFAMKRVCLSILGWLFFVIVYLSPYFCFGFYFLCHWLWLIVCNAKIFILNEMKLPALCIAGFDMGYNDRYGRVMKATEYLWKITVVFTTVVNIQVDVLAKTRHQIELFFAERNLHVYSRSIKWRPAQKSDSYYDMHSVYYCDNISKEAASWLCGHLQEF